MREHLDSYLESLAARGCSPRTVQAYRAKVNAFFAWAGDRPVEPALLHKYRMERQEAGRRPRTIRVDFTALLSFFEWLDAEKIQSGLPRRGSIKLPRMDTPQREIPSEEDVSRLFDAARKMPAHTPHKKYLRGRALAVLTLFADCGLRRAELLALTVSDVDQQGKPWRVLVRQGKGAQTRWVPLHDDAQATVGEWIEIRREWAFLHKHKSDALFPVDKARSLAQRGLEGIWDELLELAGLSGRRITPHGLRHYFATRLAKLNDFPAVQKLLGHKSLDTTLQYLHTSEQQLVDAVQTLRRSPRPDTGDAPRRLVRRSASGANRGRR